MPPRTISLDQWTPPDAPLEFDPRGVIDWAVERFDGWSMAMTTAFGLEGVALIHMLSSRVPQLRVLSVDTGFLFEETHDLRRQLEVRFPNVTFDQLKPRYAPDEQESLYGPELWKTQPEACCRMRKVEPLHRAMLDVDVWFSSVRRGQSPSRASTPIVNWDWSFQSIKVCPLVTWSRKDVYDYVARHGLPYHALHDLGFPSVGCTHCTQRVEGTRPWDYTRAGRWTGTTRTECGINR